MVPLTSLGNASYTTGPGSIKRFNMFTTAVIRGAAAQGYSSGQAMEIMEQIARDHLPDNIGVGIVRSFLPQEHEWQSLLFSIQKNMMAVMSHVATPSTIREMCIRDRFPTLPEWHMNSVPYSVP